MTPRIAVVGGGITGLSAAWFLRDRADVTLYEASHRLGGKIRTDEFIGRRVEAGPDAFLARVPQGTALATAVGLGDDLVAPSTSSAYVWARGALRRMPAGTVLGAPTSLQQLRATGLVSPLGVARAALDAVLPATRIGDDVGVGELVAARFGAEVRDHMVDPLLGGIHTGPSQRLSAAAVAPQLLSGARASRSLLRGLRSLTPAAPSDAPVFFTVRGGLSRLVDALVAATTDVRVGTAVAELGRDGSRWRVDGDLYDAVILTAPSYAAADLVVSVAPDAAAAMRTIEYASIALTLMAYPASAFRQPLDGSGFVVARDSGLLMTACSWASSKWAIPGDDVILRVSAGRWGEDAIADLDDDALVARLHDEIVRTMGASSDPTSTRVVRWPRSFPQQTVGHLGRVDALEATLHAQSPGLIVAGAAYRGLGLPACIGQAEAAATKALAGVSAWGTIN